MKRLLLIIFFFIFLTCASTISQAVDVDPSITFSTTDDIYSFETAMSFSRIDVSANWINFNDTDFNITSSRSVNVTITYLNTNMSGANGTSILRFKTNRTDQGIWFNISGFRPLKFYRVYQNGTEILKDPTNTTGTVSFYTTLDTSKEFNVYYSGATSALRFNYSIPFSDQSLDTGYFTITDLTVTYFDGIWHTIPAGDYSYSSTTGAVVIPTTSITVTTTQIRVQGEVSLSSAPSGSVFAVLGAALIILAIFSIVVLLWFKDRF